jgi:fumarate reductase subunit C
MSATPRVDSMKARRPGRTRTAPPNMPDLYPLRGRYRAYVAFGSCGIFFLLAGLLLLRAVWALGSGPEAWQEVMASFGHPLYVIYHAIAVGALLWFTLRFFRLFPKSQPPRIGPAKPPPEPVLLAALHGALVVATLLVVLLLGGVIP